MKARTKLILVTVTFLTAITLTAGPQTDSARLMFEAAKKKEVVDGDLNSAIQQYKSIVTKYPKERAVAADALIRMADCYRKLGDSEARKIYERIIREFADQKEPAAIAKSALGTPDTSAGMVSRRVWNTQDTNGTISPDGRYISYIDWSTGALALHDLRTGTERSLVSDGLGGKYKEFAEYSTISRDGKQIVYSWRNTNRNYELRLANIEGSPSPRPLLGTAEINWIAAYDWSPDGKSVLVALRRTDKTSQFGFVSILDGTLRVLKSIDGSVEKSLEGSQNRIFLSPDGKYVAYSAPALDATREHDILLLTADGLHETVVVADPSVNFVMGWSQDGKHLLFASDRTGSMSLWRLEVADGKSQGTPELIRSDIGMPRVIGMTRSGAFYYAIWPTVVSNLQVASFDPQTGQTFSAKIIGQEKPESNTLPYWSPDGRFLAYLSSRGVRTTSGSNFSLVIRSMEKDQVRELPLRLDNARLLGWAPDGQSFRIAGLALNGKWGYYRIDDQTGDMAPIAPDLPEPLVSAVYDAAGWLSADGKALYYRRASFNQDEFSFIRRDLASGAERELAHRALIFPKNSGAGGGYINLSPDGQYIATAFPGPSDHAMTVLLVPTNGEPARELMQIDNKRLPDGCPGQPRGIGTWDPDSRSILIRACSDGKQADMWRIFLNGDAPRKLEASTFPGHSAIHPAGRRIAFTTTPPITGGQLAQIWALENFLPTPKTNK